MDDCNRTEIALSRDVLLPVLKIGSFGFGGPIAIIALLEQEYVYTQKRVSPERFKELYSIVKLFPGTVAFQLLLALIHELTGSRRKAILSGIAFLAPSFFLVLGIAFFVMKDLSKASAQGALTGVQIAALGLMAHSVLRLLGAIKNTPLTWVGIAIAASMTFAFPKTEPLLIFVYGAIALNESSLRKWIPKPGPREVASLAMLFWVCFRSSLLVFGTGIAIVPLLELDFVSENHWLTSSDFLTALSVGQITPGPVLITTTFLGYQLRGIAGALITTLGSFLPGVLLSLWVLPSVTNWMKTNQRGERFGRAAFVAVLGGLTASISRLGIQSLLNPMSVGIFALVLVGTFAFKRIPWSAWILIGGYLHSLG